MHTIVAINYSGSLPASFFDIPQAIYSSLPLDFSEDVSITNQLFQEEASRNEIVLYTDHASVRLAGIYPNHSTDAYFGFWETTNEEALCKLVFSMLEKDARKRGRTNIIGPINFNTFHNYRLRVGNYPSWISFDREPTNPLYYPSLLEFNGFTSRAEFESRLITSTDVPEVYKNKEQLLQALKTVPYKFIPLDEHTWAKYEDEIFVLLDAIFSQNPMYKQISQSQFKLLYNASYAQKLCPYSSVMLRDKASGQLAGISMCHPNYHPLKLENKSVVFAQHFPLLSRKTLLVKTVGVHPSFRQQGLMNYMGAYGMLSFREHYEDVIFCLMRSDNYSLQFTNGFRLERATYMLYQKTLV